MRLSSLYTKCLQLSIALLLLSGCGQKNCSTDTSPITTLTGQQFRLNSTTNSSILLNNFNTLVVEFKNDFTGTLSRLSNNRLYPVATLLWNVNYTTKQLRIQYTPNDSGDTGSNPGTSGNTSTVTYTIKLGYPMIWTEADTGRNYTYSWGHYTGAADPGDLKNAKCVFR